ncbi:MAG: PA2778 family cysteine peptidase [Pseudomonadales bacterium]
MPALVRRPAALILAMLLACAGCASLGPPLASQPVELTATPFHPQQDYLCGPAALATVLQPSGVNVHPDALIADLYIPERQGTLQVELAAAARRQGRLAVELGGTLGGIVRQLERGRPVLVLQNLATRRSPVWHYAVVVGYQPDGNRFVLRSGRERRQIMAQSRFQATWKRADNWALVVVDPEAEPSGLDAASYLRAAADLERSGAHQQALRAFRSATGAWPDQPTALLGQANNLYYLARFAEAEALYGQLVAEQPNQLVAIHNLTMLLLEQGRYCQAQAVVQAAADHQGELMERARGAVATAPAGACP